MYEKDLYIGAVVRSLYETVHALLFIIVTQVQFLIYLKSTL